MINIDDNILNLIEIIKNFFLSPFDNVSTIIIAWNFIQKVKS